MIATGGFSLTPRKAQMYAIQEVCVENNGLVSDWKTAQHNPLVQKAVATKMQDRLTGRPQILRPTKPSANTEIRFDRLNVRTYPKKLETDVQKYKWLKDLIEHKSIPFGVYVDLLNELRLEGKVSKKKQYTFSIGLDVFL